MTVELGHRILQLRHGVMSGKTQTGQKQLTKQKGKDERGTSSQDKKQNQSQTQGIEQERGEKKKKERTKYALMGGFKNN